MALIARLTLSATFAGLLVCSQAFGARFNAKNVKPTGLTANQAEQVLLVVLKQEGFKTSDSRLWLDGPWLTDGKPSIPGYHSFGVVYVASTQGHYSVNIITGDVWQTESCRRYIFPALSKIQRGIAERTGKQLANDEDARNELGCLAESI
ncbi:hypothetical protein [Massilia aquatica]|uniref:Uncharacterized protein n=1 Tax=Massilia aquatica TaxID=2609000 RepID=A0ABX0ML39_9BURK|nr:hypothetical protein [Massilia aquatica]NHZ44224.1 hypothetical protein [Massilia aquatica]